MKRILIPIDLSPAAATALRYTASFAHVTGAEIICLHVSADDDGSSGMSADVHSFVEQNLAGIPDKPIVRSMLRQGILESAVSEVLRKDHIDLIAMGTKGAKGFQKVLSGSHTTDLLSSVVLPMLIIPQDYVFRPIRYILWATDFEGTRDLFSLTPLVDTARAFDAEVRMAEVVLSERHHSVNQHMETRRADHLMGDNSIRHSFKKIKWTDISGGIRYYLELKGDNDLLVMVRHQHGFLSRVFRQDHVYEFACDPVMPLLIFHD